MLTFMIEKNLAEWRFNTENGRGRAAIASDDGKFGKEVKMFQYRERSWEGCNRTGNRLLG